MAWRNGTVVSLISDLADFAAGQLHIGRQRILADGSVDAAQQSKLSLVVSSHRCSLVETVRNGDCGLDAIIKNMQRLNMRHQVLDVLGKKGVSAACKILRLQLCIWLKQNCDLKALPDLTLSDWMCLDEHETVDAYIAHMRQDGAWLDTVMLYAASALLNLQFLIFLPDSGPQLLAARNVQESGKAAVGLLANLRNQHFYAVQPVTTESEPIQLQRPGGLLSAEFPRTVADPEECADDDDGDDEVANFDSPQSEPSASSQVLFRMCSGLIRWDPFGSQRNFDELGSLVRQLGDETTADETGEVLRWREAVKLLQHEQAVGRRQPVRPTSAGKGILGQKVHFHKQGEIVFQIAQNVCQAVTGCYSEELGCSLSQERNCSHMS